jgi:hypothetical protein
LTRAAALQVRNLRLPSLCAVRRTIISSPALVLLNFEQTLPMYAHVLFEVGKMGNQTLEQTIALEEPNELARVETQLRIHLHGYVHDFRVIVENAGLILYGRARTYYGKQLAQQSVMQRSRLPILANKIEVS